MIYEITLNNHYKRRIEEKKEGEWMADGEPVTAGIAGLQEGLFHVIFRNRSYNVELDGYDPGTKSGRLIVNGNRYDFSAKDRYDELLEQLGMAGSVLQKVNELKAPMPGLVLKMLTVPGQEVKKGDNLLVLEAMKMENIIKSPGDGRVKAVCVKAGDAVEKNEVLIKFES